MHLEVQTNKHINKIWCNWAQLFFFAGHGYIYIYINFDCLCRISLSVACYELFSVFSNQLTAETLRTIFRLISEPATILRI